MKLLRTLNNALESFEGILASIALLFMVGLSFLQVMLRNLWDTGISWCDPNDRALVVWVVYLGASIATRQ
ncbi:MAG: TRAP transporter small permease, partial [Candidatus Binatia bacterium]